jgi:hypothetical protein
MRYDRVASVLINVGFPEALRNLLAQIGVEPDEASDLSSRWFTDNDAKAEVAEHLARNGLDEHAIEAEAIRACGAQLEPIHKALGVLDIRFRTALASLSEYRGATIKLSEIPNRLIESKPIERLRGRSSVT